MIRSMVFSAILRALCGKSTRTASHCWCAAALVLCLIAGCRDPLTELTPKLQSANAEERRAAAKAVGELGPRAAPAAPALVDLLGDKDRQVRRVACTALGQVQPPADVAVPALKQALKDRYLAVRIAAAFALQQIAPKGKDHVPVLTKAMRTGDGGVIVAVGEVGPRAAWAVPVLSQLLKDQRAGIRRVAAEALGRIGPAAAPALPLLEAAATDPSDDVRLAAETAKTQIAGQAPEDARLPRK
ncbi:MAG: HEAT repeat domain-containing protein [Planctomycetota bacterium]